MSERWHRFGAPMAAAIASGALSEALVRRMLAGLGRLQAGAFLRVAGARWAAMRAVGRDAPTEAAIRALHRRMEHMSLTVPLDVADLAVDGDDLRRLGIPAGPIYAKILCALLEQVLDEPARNTPDALLAEVPRLVAGPDGEMRTRTPPRTEPW
jgi:tRNA nucleotidyltransferase (CCA-adding enzyme)